MVPLLLACASDADTDGDGLSDREERRLGTDPERADTDRDGYRDGDEVAEGHDPLDPDDRIYVGGWPYHHDKDRIPTDDVGVRALAGHRFLRAALVDQHGDRVDLYDFYEDGGRPVMIDLSGVWCEPCLTLGAWIAGDPASGDWEAEHAAVRAAVAAGDLHWITVVAEDAAGAPVLPGAARAWADAYPSERVAVLEDPDQVVADYVAGSVWPKLVLLGPDLRVVAIDPLDPDAVLAAAGAAVGR